MRTNLLMHGDQAPGYSSKIPLNRAPAEGFIEEKRPKEEIQG